MDYKEVSVGRPAIIALVVAICALPEMSMAEIYRCEISGKATFTDKPCPQGSVGTRYSEDDQSDQKRSASSKVVEVPKPSYQVEKTGESRWQAADRLVSEYETTGSQIYTQAMRRCMKELVGNYVSVDRPMLSDRKVKIAVERAREECFFKQSSKHNIAKMAQPGWNVVQQMKRNDEKSIKATGLEFLAKNKSKPGVIATSSGLQYEIIEPGIGESPGPSDVVKVRYLGTHLSGEEFGSPGERVDGAAELHISRVIQGWQEGLRLMKRGSIYRFYVPPALAYGSRGISNHVAPDEVLQFEIELVDFYAPASKANQSR